MKSKIALLLTLAVFLPSAIAFNCNSLSGGDLQVCNSIQSTNLSSVDKDLLISDIFNKNRTSPNFDFIYSWNTNLNIANSPDGKIYSSWSIKNAWVKTIALMPSIIENNVLYSTSSGKLQTAYSYTHQMPSGTVSGDCKTTYSLYSKSENLDVLINGNFIGKGKLVSFANLNQNTNQFTSRLSISITYKINHYKTKEYCCSYDSDGYCIKYCTKCSLYNTEYKTDTLTISDQLTAKLYKNQISSKFKILDKYNGLTKGVLTADNFTSLTLSFNNSKYQKRNYVYSLNYTLPYYVLTIRADPVNNIQFSNIHVDNCNKSFYFTIQDTSNCKIQLNDFFNSVVIPCDLSFNKLNFSISTDKTYYFDNDTIRVYITPNDILVNLSYGNTSITAIGYATFKPVFSENKIYARLNDQEQVLLINVNKKEDFITLYQLGIIFCIGYFCYKASKVYLSGIMEAK